MSLERPGSLPYKGMLSSDWLVSSGSGDCDGWQYFTMNRMFGLESNSESDRIRTPEPS